MRTGGDMALKDAIQDIILELREISDLRKVPDEPPEQSNQFPFVTVFPEYGNYHTGPPGLVTGIHDIRMELHVVRRDLPRDYEKVINLIDEIPEKLYTTLKDSGFSNLETFGDITYEFSALNYGGVDTLGVIYRITGVKVQTIL